MPGCPQGQQDGAACCGHMSWKWSEELWPKCMLDRGLPIIEFLLKKTPDFLFLSEFFMAEATPFGSRPYYHCGARDLYGNFKIKEHRNKNHSNNDCSWLYRTCVYQHYRHIVCEDLQKAKTMHLTPLKNLPGNCRSKASSPAWLTPRASKSL